MKRIAGFEERRLVQSCATNVDEKQSTGALQITHRSELPNMIRVNVVESTDSSMEVIKGFKPYTNENEDQPPEITGSSPSRKGTGEHVAATRS